MEDHYLERTDNFNLEDTSPKFRRAKDEVAQVGTNLNLRNVMGKIWNTSTL